MQRTSTVPISALDWFAIPAADFDRALRFYEAILEAPMRVGDFGGEKIAVFPHDEVGPVVRSCREFRRRPGRSST